MPKHFIRAEGVFGLFRGEFIWLESSRKSVCRDCGLFEAQTITLEHQSIVRRSVDERSSISASEMDMGNIVLWLLGSFAGW